MKRLHLLFLIGIVLLAALLRLSALRSNPPELTWDEVAWGYNGYALGIDGKDEFGRFLPLDYIESFGDFKPPVYAYLTVVPIKLFGLNAFATRLPSALLGTMTVLLAYYLAKKICKNDVVALVAAAVLAISPWHIMLSRAAFEANVATCFIVAGVWLFLESITPHTETQKKLFYPRAWLLPVSIVFFVLSMYTFNTPRVVTPILVFVLLASFYKTLLRIKKQTIFAGVIGVVLLLPALPFLLSPQAALRFQEVNIFSDIGVVKRTNMQIANDHNAFWSKIIHNRRYTYGVEFLRHYIDNLTPSFLFIRGDGNPKFSTQDVGQMYMWELPFLLAGILFLFKKREGYWWIIPVWLLVGILPAATARETPHALRIETTLPTFQILVAYGVVEVFAMLLRKKPDLRYTSIGLLVFVVLLNLSYFLHGYIVHYPKEYSGEWQYGYREAIAFVQQQYNAYDSIYITEALGRPYAYVLFYTRYNPEEFRKTAVVEREALGFVHVQHFDKYYFAKNLSALPTNTSKTLYIDIPEQVPSSAYKIKTFQLLNGKGALVAYTK